MSSVGTWPRYLAFVSCSLLSMAAGTQVVHLYYQPLKGFDEKVKERAQEIRRERELQKLQLKESW